MLERASSTRGLVGLISVVCKLKKRHQVDVKSVFRRFSTAIKVLAGKELVVGSGASLLSSPPDMSVEAKAILDEATPYSMTGAPRLAALIDAVQYIVEKDVPGAFVECGVWRGGSVLAMIRTLQAANVTDRDIYLYDTFTGMTPPTSEDLSDYDLPATVVWEGANEAGERAWDHLFNSQIYSLSQVRELLLATGYPEERLHFVVGKVEDTIPKTMPKQLALLRLDTDWYVSTKHELHHLYPNLSQHGVLIIDDYGHWKGCRQAVDEYFSELKEFLLLNRVDYTCRIAVRS